MFLSSLSLNQSHGVFHKETYEPSDAPSDELMALNATFDYMSDDGSSLSANTFDDANDIHSDVTLKMSKCIESTTFPDSCGTHSKCTDVQIKGDNSNDRGFFLTKRREIEELGALESTKEKKIKSGREQSTGALAETNMNKARSNRRLSRGASKKNSTSRPRVNW